MSRTPKRSRVVRRSSDVPAQALRSKARASGRTERRQSDLFDQPFISPMLPTLADRVPTGPLWHYEVKHDGYRVQAYLRDGQVRLYTRRGLDWTERMPAIVRAVAGLRCRSAILDGEAVTCREDGVADFYALHAKLQFGKAPEACLIAFDALFIDGEDLRPAPLAERRTILAEALVGAGHGLELSEHLTEGGEAMFRAAAEMGCEGIVAKRRDRPYTSGRSDDWIKVKATTREHFAVVGFEPEGRTGIACLRLCRLVDGQLTPCGRVGSGFSEQASRQLRKALDAGAHIVVEVEHRGFTPAGELRAPVFKGWHRE